MGNYIPAQRKLALKRVKDALFHLPFEDKVKVLVATLKSIGAKAYDLEDKKNDTTNAD